MEFFETNIGSVEQFATVWEAFKVFIRGVAINKPSGVLRSIRSRLALLEVRLGELEREAMSRNDPQITEQLKKTIEEYHEEADSEIKHMGKYASARTYGEGDRPGSVLAAVEHRRLESGVVTELLGENGSIPKEQVDIVNRFGRYYPDLYSSKVTPGDEDILNYLEYIQLPWLTDRHREYLMRPLDSVEI